MTRRTNEKHLEDWICDNWGSVNIHLGKFIGRQIVLPNGICDILSVSNGLPIVTELKAGKLSEKDIGQLLRYVGDVKRYLRGYAICNNNFKDYKKTNIEIASTAFDAIIELGHQMPVAEAGVQDSMLKMLIGKSVDSRVIASAEASDIRVYTYEYSPDDDTFEFVRVRSEYAYSNSYPYWVVEMSNEIVESSLTNAKMQADMFYKSLFQ